ncbi:magnetosome biogenesis CDF transporter MamM [Deltaproteobacteria bacterium TL4]
MQIANCTVCYRFVGWIGLGSNLFMSLLKLFVGIVSGSQALIADAMYSAKDLVTSILIIVGLKISVKPVDKEHMYGHGKVEFLLALVVSIVFIIVTGMILFFTADHFIQGKHKVPNLIALFTALFSIVTNLFLYKYTRCVTRQINSPMVKTLSKHHWADMLSSLAVAGGIIGAHYLGLTWLDSLIAIFETLHLLYLGVEVLWEAVQGLMDYSAPEEMLDEIKKNALEVDKVRSLVSLKTRRIGQGLWIDIVIGVDPDMNVGDAHKVMKSVELNIFNSLDHITNINVRFESVEGLPQMDLLPVGE